MRNTALLIQKEHERIEQILQDLEVIICEEEINYPALVHTFRELKDFWDAHEIKEIEFFKLLAQKKIKVPQEKIDFEHGDLKKCMNNLIVSINEGKNNKTQELLETQCRDLIDDLREHMKQEDWIFVALPLEDLETE
jgi:hypothetical protein